MRRPRQKLQVNTFPFLAVLLCAMGSLILFLLVMDRRAKIATQSKALAAQSVVSKQKDDTDKERDEWEKQKQNLHRVLEQQQAELKTEATKVQSQVTQTSKKIDVHKAHYQEIQKSLESEKSKLAQLEGRIKSEQDRVKQVESKDASARSEILNAALDLQDLEKTLKEMKLVKNQEKNTFSVVPYRGKRGESRKPIYVECTATALIFHPDRKILDGIRFDVIPLRGEVEQRAGGLMREKTAKELSREPEPTTRSPYVLFLVRPDGIGSYYKAQSFLKGFQLDFGYEFLDAHWTLDFSTDQFAGSETPATNIASATPKVSPLPPLPGIGSGVSPNQGVPGGGIGVLPGIPGGVPALPGIPGETGVPALPGIPGEVGGGTALPGIPGVPGGNGGSGVPALPGIPGGSGNSLAGGGVPGIPGGYGMTGGRALPALPGIAGGNNGPGGSGMTGGSGVPALPGIPNGPGLVAGSGVPGGSGVPSLPGIGSPGGTQVAGAMPTLPGIGEPGKGSATAAPGGATGISVGLGTPGSFNSSFVPVSQAPNNIPIAVAGPGTKQSVIASTSQMPDRIVSTPNPIAGGQPQQQPLGGGPLIIDETPPPPAVPNYGIQPPPPAPPNAFQQEGGVPPQPSSPQYNDPLNRLASPGLPTGAPPKTPPPLGRILGNRDFVITVDCYADHVTVFPGGTQFRWKTADIAATDQQIASLVKNLIARRQSSVQPGEPPYRPQVRFQVSRDGLRTYYHVYPLIEPLRLPMTRENLED